MSKVSFLHSHCHLYSIFLTTSTEPNANVHRSVARNNCISKLVLFANIFLCLVGAAVICMSIFLFSRARNGGIAAYLFREGLLLKSVAALAFVIFCGGLLSIIAGFMYGIRQVAPSIIEGMSVDERRRGLMWYLATILFAILFLGLGLFASVIPAHTISKTLTDATWRSMCRSHPDRICRYEVHNRCAGVADLQCTSSSASSNVACPGHFCALGCKAGAKQAVGEKRCERCVKVFRRGDLLGKCRASEANKQFAGGCGRRLRSELVTFFRVAIYAAGIGLSTIAMASIASTAALFLCISEG